MASAKNDLSRQSQSTNRMITIRLSQINLDKDRDYCHRLGDALSKKKLKELAESLVQEGQKTPMTVFDSGQTDDQGDKIYILVGGHRRFKALKRAIIDHLADEYISPDMEIFVVEIVKGESQSQKGFQQDLLVASVTENENREGHSTDEKLEIVKQFLDLKVPAPRAASSLCVKERQYGRFVAVASREWLHKHVTNNEIGITHAAELVLAAESRESKGQYQVDWFKADLEKWAVRHRRLLEEERAEQTKIGKKLTGTAAQVKKYFTKDVYAHWLKLIEAGQRFGGEPEFAFGIVVNEDKKTITVPGRTLKTADLRSDDFETMIAELSETADKLIPLMRECRAAERARDISEEERQEELERILEKRRRARQEAEEAETGHDAAGFDETEDPDPQPVDADETEE
ncbi:MAG: hypothetical protein ACYTG0_03620 [Planctomycetota bacterium]|jgi:hypothetical protein